MIALLILTPPVGAYVICSRADVRLWCKLLTLLYCAVLIVFLLRLRAPLGEVTIDARRILP